MTAEPPDARARRMPAPYTPTGLHRALDRAAPTEPGETTAAEGGVAFRRSGSLRPAAHAYLRITDRRVLLLVQRIAAPDYVLQARPSAVLAVHGPDGSGRVEITVMEDRTAGWTFRPRRTALGRTPVLTATPEQAAAALRRLAR